MADINEPAGELERLIAELSGLGPLVFVFGDGPSTAHLKGVTETALHCYIHDLYDGQRMRPEKLAAWHALRDRYGNRDESKVNHGTLLALAA